MGEKLGRLLGAIVGTIQGWLAAPADERDRRNKIGKAKLKKNRKVLAA